ncbi:MAG: hypothetical protein V1836_03655 [Candidatus Aenigmatarchaeota archaeon]
MKALTEATLAVLIGFIIALVFAFLMLGWVENSGDNIERERSKLASTAGCLTKENACGFDDNKACVYTLDGQNACGCRAWLGIDKNGDCAEGKKCSSERGTNYGFCV